MAGKKISRANMARIQQIADHAHALGARHPGMADYAGKADQSLGEQMQAVRTAVAMAVPSSTDYPYVEDVYDSYIVIEIGDACYRADYTVDDAGAVTLAARESWVEVEEVWQPVGQAAAKAGLLIADEAAGAPPASIKALADRQIEVKVAYGGHNRGRDSHNEYFSAKTDFDGENFPAPPLLYYHGFDEHGRRMGKPAVTGTFLSRRSGHDAHYLIYQLKTTKYADLQWEAALKSQCVVSPGTVGYLIRKAADGELLYWPLAEISAWDYAPNRKAANAYSVAAPILKALYLEEGLTPPSALDTPPPEAAGDAASAAGPPIDPSTAQRLIAHEIAQMVLGLRKGS